MRRDNNEKNTAPNIQTAPAKERVYNLTLTAVITMLCALVLFGSRYYGFYHGISIIAIAWVGVLCLVAVGSSFFKRPSHEIAMTYALPKPGAAAMSGLLFACALLVSIPLSLYGDMAISAIGANEFTAASYIGKSDTTGFIVVLILLPATVTELLHRRFALSRISQFCGGKKALTVLISALLYSIFFLNAADSLSNLVIGAALAFTALEFGSLLLPFVFSLIKFSADAFWGWYSQQGNTGGETMGFRQVTSIFLICAGIAFAMFALDVYLINKRRGGKYRLKALDIIVVLLSSAVIVAIGAAII